MNFVDIIVIGIIGLSALLAFSRGFVKEVLSILGWVGALIATFLFFPSVEPIVAQFIGEPLLAKIATGAGIFILALVLCGVINHWISEKVRGHGLSSLDRSLGLLFGLARGVLIVGICYIVFAWALRDPNDWPAAVKEARALPLVARIATLIQERLPENLVEQGQSAIGQGVDQGKAIQQIMPGLGFPNTGTTPAPAPNADPAAPPAPADANGQTPESGYKDQERNDLDQLIQGTQGTQ